MRLQADLITNKNSILEFRHNSFTDKLEVGKRYVLNILSYVQDRSLEQNRRMWAIINKISKVSGKNKDELYIEGLRYADVVSDIVYCKSKKAIEGQYRAIEFLSLVTLQDNTQLEVYTVWKGSSTYSKKEMILLMDYFTSVEYQNGIELED